MTSTLFERPSTMLAAEVRAAIAREGLNMAEVARRLDVPQAWLSRRIGKGAMTDLTLDEVVQIADALGVSAQGILLAVLPRLDSNQQPSGYLSAQVSEACWCPDEAPMRHPACPDRLTRADLGLVA